MLYCLLQEADPWSGVKVKEGSKEFIILFGSLGNNYMAFLINVGSRIDHDILAIKDSIVGQLKLFHDPEQTSPIMKRKLSFSQGTSHHF